MEHSPIPNPDEYSPFESYSTTPPPTPTKTHQEQAKTRVYGQKAALTLEATYRKGHSDPANATVSIEIAPKYGDATKWSDKITVQLSDSELPVFCAVCLGFLPETQFIRQNKSIRLKRQSKKLYLSASNNTGLVIGVPVPIGESYLLSTLALHQLARSSFTQDSALLLAAIRGAAALHTLAD